MIRVGVNGYGTIGKRVADAVSKQEDMKIIGVVKTKPDYEALTAIRKGYDLYIPKDREKDFREKKIDFKGFIEELFEKSDIIVDATPAGVGAKYKDLYERNGLKAVFQGGEKESVAEVSFNALANYEEAIGKRFIRVVSCNTTGLIRVLWSINRIAPIKRVRAVIIRRGADPKEIDKGPINSLTLDPPKIPSHHAHDVKTVLKDLDIITMAVATPTTLMHIHTIFIETYDKISRDRLIDVLSDTPRIILVDSNRTGIKSTSQIIELTRDLGRERYDIYENVIFRDTIHVDGEETMLSQAIHQEAIVIPENIDAIRASLSLKKRDESINETDKKLNILRGEVL